MGRLCVQIAGIYRSDHELSKVNFLLNNEEWANNLSQTSFFYRQEVEEPAEPEADRDGGGSEDENTFVMIPPGIHAQAMFAVAMYDIVSLKTD